MKIVIITTDGPEQRYVSKHLIEVLGNHLSGIVIEQGANKISLVSSLKKASRRYGGLTVLERIITKIYRKIIRGQNRQALALNKILGKTYSVTNICEDIPILEVESANNDECIKWINDILPDYIFVYGTGIIRKKVLLLPSKQTLNLHTGVSPYYRGSDCAFWPLYNKEPLMVGATVHKCTPEIDGGDIYGRVSVRLSENDDSYLAFAKSVKAGSILYSRIAKSLSSGEVILSEKQDFSLGKEYRFKDRTFAREILMEYRSLTGQIKKSITENRDQPLPYPQVEEVEEKNVE